LRNRTAYAAQRNWTRDKDGIHWWIVAVRATFEIGAAGRLLLADKQLPPTLAPEYFGEPGASSLRYDSDLLAIRPGTDVIVHATAYAPGERSAASVPVAIRVGSIDKRLMVHGERVYYEGTVGLTATAPRPFTQRPIRYELAYGGRDLGDADPRKHRIDERNPIGRGFARRTATLAKQPAHAIEYLDGDPAARGARSTSAGPRPRSRSCPTIMIPASRCARRRISGRHSRWWAASGRRC
jgi:hypothetical protein